MSKQTQTPSVTKNMRQNLKWVGGYDYFCSKIVDIDK